jgi:methylenetetrahydrofolate reductase (NADPH)
VRKEEAVIGNHLIEILTPRQSRQDIDVELDKFSQRYLAVLDTSYMVSIPDNPMGNLHYQSTEVISELGLPVDPDRLLVHLNTFHTRSDLDNILSASGRLGVRYMLIVSGDGGERLPRLAPASVGATVNTVTSVELLRHIHREHPGEFTCGVAFNQYEPLDHEVEKMRRKVDAGARFIITQPVIGRDDRVDALRQFGLPVAVGAWMAPNLQLFADCIGYAVPDGTPYDPMANLRELREHYPRYGVYLALLRLKTQLPQVREILAPHVLEAEEVDEAAAAACE